MSNIERDQNTRPRARSQSHKPQRPAVERGVDAAAHGVVDQIGLPRARRLPVESEAEDQHHEAGRRRQRHGKRGHRSPVGQRAARRLHHGDDAQRVLQRPHRGEGGGAVRQRDLQRAGGGAERGQRLRRSEHIENLATELQRIARHAGDDRAIGVADDDRSALRRSPGRQGALQRRESATGVRSAVSAGMVERDGEFVGERLHDLAGVDDDLAALFEHLHDGADANRYQKGDDENRDGAAQQRLGAQQPPIRGFGNRFCQPLNRIGT